MTVQAMRPVLTVYVVIHVTVVQMPIALSRITVPSALAKQALKATPTLHVMLVRQPSILKNIINN
jgi:hypothetical protein